MLLADPSLKILVIALVPKPLGGKLDNSLGRWITRWAIGHGGLVFSHQARPQGNPIPFLYYLLSLLRQYSQWCGKPGCWLLAAGLWLVAGCRPLAVASGLFPEKLSPIQLDHNRSCYPGETEAAVLANFWHLPVGRNFDPKAIRSVGASAQPGSDLGLEGGDKRLGTHREWLIVAGFALDQAAFGDGAPADSLYWLWGERQLPMHTAVTSSQ